MLKRIDTRDAQGETILTVLTILTMFNSVALLRHYEYVTMVDQVSKISHTDSVRLGFSQIFYTSKDSISFQFYPTKAGISRHFWPKIENLGCLTHLC